MSIAARENDLFARWSTTVPDLVRDGVADEETFLGSTPRLAFVLKEANDPGGGGWDLREFMRKGARSQTWNVITRWTLGIRALPYETPWSRLAVVSPALREMTLSSICAFNLKKSPGGNTADGAAIAAACQRDSALLQEQFDLYSPDLVICCGSATWDPFASIAACDASALRRTSRDVAYYEYKPGGFVIHYCHPEARVYESLIHYGLMDAVEELRSASRSNVA